MFVIKHGLHYYPISHILCKQQWMKPAEIKLIVVKLNYVCMDWQRIVIEWLPNVFWW